MFNVAQEFTIKLPSSNASDCQKFELMQVLLHLTHNIMSTTPTMKNHMVPVSKCHITELSLRTSLVHDMSLSYTLISLLLNINPSIFTNTFFWVEYFCD